MPELPPFVLSPAPATPEREGSLDIYRPSGTQQTPAILFVHGGPSSLPVPPRDWPVYRGYAAEVTARGMAAGVVDHCLVRGTTPRLLGQADEEVTAAADRLRAAAGIDQDRIALWFFSGSGLLVAPWLDRRPSWLRCIAATYPRFCPRDDLPPGMPTAREAIARAPRLPVVLTRVGLERPELAEAVDAFIAFIAASTVHLEVVDSVPGPGPGRPQGSIIRHCRHMASTPHAQPGSS